MNFLLHRQLAVRDLGSAAAGLGGMLPDLWRMADRRVRARARDRSAVRSPGLDGRLVLAGIEHHLAVDTAFHASPVLEDGERTTRDLLRAGGVAAPKTGLLAHAIWEMALDGALVRREGVEATLAAVRASLAVGPETMRWAATEEHFSIAGDRGRDAFDARMERIVAELARGPWIEGYADGQGLALRVAGVRARVGLPPPDAADLARLASALDALARTADAALDDALAISSS